MQEARSKHAIRAVFFSWILCLLATTSTQAQEDTLKLFFWQAPTIVNPHLSPGTKDLSASRISYEPLASFNAAGELVPFLAAEIPSLENGGVAQDGRSVTWRLKQDVMWSDGHPFTASDVLFTYEYIANPQVAATSKSAYDLVDSVEALDDFTVKVNFKSHNPVWSIPFVGVKGMIIPRHVFEGFNGLNAQEAPANRVPIGTGSYRGLEFKEEDILIIGEDAVSTVKIVFEPNPHFRESGKPFFKRVELQGGGGDAVFAAKLVEDGVADYAWNLQVDEQTLIQMEAGGKGHAIELLGAWVERIMINFSDPNQATEDGERSSLQFPHPMFSDKRVRRATAFAIDRQAIADLYGRGGRVTSNILMSPTGYQSSNTTWRYDLSEARSLLDEAGWVDEDGDGVREKNNQPLRILFQTSVNPVRQKTQMIVQQSLESIGFAVELKSIDSSIFFGPITENTNTRRHFYADLEEFAYSNKSPDPAAYMQAWTCDEIAQRANNWASSNWARYCSSQYDAAFRKAAREIDLEKRQQLFIHLNDLLIGDVAVIPLVHLVDFGGISNTLVGLDLTPWDVDVWNIKDWKRK